MNNKRKRKKKTHTQKKQRCIHTYTQMKAECEGSKERTLVHVTIAITSHNLETSLKTSILTVVRSQGMMPSHQKRIDYVFTLKGYA
jgi:hypothetical protein